MMRSKNVIYRFFKWFSTSALRVQERMTLSTLKKVISDRFDVSLIPTGIDDDSNNILIDLGCR